MVAPRALLVILVVWTVGLTAERAGGDTFVLPHVLEVSGRITNTPYTFDTTIFATYAAGLGGGAATVDLYVFDETTGAPLRGSGGTNVANPVSATLNAANPSVQWVVDDLIVNNGGGFPAGNPVVLGFGLIVVNGDPDGVNITSAVVNARSGPGDLAVFGFDPQPIPAATSGAGESSYWLGGLLEGPGRADQYGGCFDTTIFAVYTAGLVDGLLPSGAQLDVYLFDETTGLPLRVGGGDVCGPCTFSLDADHRKASILLDDLITAAGGFSSIDPLSIGARVVVTGDVENVALQGLVVNSHTSPFDVTMSFVDPVLVPEPGTAGLLLSGSVFVAVGARRRARPRRDHSYTTS